MFVCLALVVIMLALMPQLYSSFSHDDNRKIRKCGTKDIAQKVGVQRYSTITVWNEYSDHDIFMSLFVITQACTSCHL